VRKLLILAALAIVTYLPALQLPFIDDDYGEIPMAAGYLSTGWAPLWQNPNFRSRTTNLALNGGLDLIFGFTPVPFYVVSILVHVLCVWLIYALCCWSGVIDQGVAFWSAGFFAVFEGHQEAVMWISGRNEELVFLVGMSALVCWIQYLRGRRVWWYALAVAAMILAAVSKESFIVFPLLMLLPCIWPPAATSRRTALLAIIPFFAIACGFGIWAWVERIIRPQYFDNRFSILAPWPLVLLRSWWRLIFAWGLAAAAVILWIGRTEDRRKAGIAIGWMLVTILPYSFLTYMPQIASRHTYISSAGLALLVGTAAARLQETNHRVLLAIASIAVVAMNLEIVWVKKMAQFRERAEPAVLLREAARDSSGPITVHCIPFSDFLAECVLATGGRRAVFPPPVVHDDHCFSIDYVNSTGSRVRIMRQVRMGKHGLFY
jgi:hypothetical protein